MKINCVIFAMGLCHADTISFYLDNDGFVGTDVEYTSGLRLAYQFDHQESGQWRGVSLTHQMFTPASHWLKQPPLDERPYSGWLAFGYGHGVAEEGHTRAFEWSIGVTGEWALSEPMQEIAHTFEDYPGHQGWDSQIPTEVTFNLFYDEQWRVLSSSNTAPLGYDFWLGGQGSLGTYETSIGGSAILRVGWNLPKTKSAERLSHTAYDFTSSDDLPWSLYLHSGVKASYTLHSLPLEGGLFRDYETEVSLEPFGVEWTTGITYQYRSYTFGAGYARRTEDYNQESHQHDYGYVSFSYSY